MTYAHYVPSADRDAADRLDSALAFSSSSFGSGLSHT